MHEHDTCGNCEECEQNIAEEAEFAAAEEGAREVVAEGAEEGTESGPQSDYRKLLDRYQRSLAEFDNFRKRTAKEKSSAHDDGVRDAIEKLLPILDNFERALAASEDKDDTFYQGVAMIAKQLDGYLQDLGVESVELGTFDPNLHFAVAHVEDESKEQQEIIEELQKGYIYKGKVIRPAMVRVAN